MTQTANKPRVQIRKSDNAKYVWINSVDDADFVAYVQRVGGWSDKAYLHTLYKDTDKIYDVVTDKLTRSKWLARTYQEVK